jgi:Bacterioferritin (cytochrome b1)
VGSAVLNTRGAYNPGGTPMQSTPEIIELLNDVLTAELTAINQYFVHYKMQENWGYDRLASKGNRSPSAR